MIAAAVSLVLGVLLGAAVGWFAHSARTSGSISAAQAQVDALRESRDSVTASMSWATEDAARRQSSAIGSQVNHIVEPLRSTLTQLTDELRRVEHNRVGAYAGLAEQVRGMHATSMALGDQTRQLANALHSSHVRGRWGEIQLERVVELAGMTRHCDFSTQVTARSDESGTVRPDVVVHLAGGRAIVVDAKVPLDAYLRAADTADDAERDRRLADHARSVRAHIGRLSSKAYWTAFDNTPEMVVLFLPAEAVLEAAARIDPELIEFGFGKNVVIATPTTLVALLRTVALGWRHDAMARDAAVIHELGTTLHHRLNSVLQHFENVGTSLRKTVESYNSAVGVVENRLGVTARRLADLEALSTSGEPPTPAVIHTTCRTIDAPPTTTPTPGG
ncbi:DNA recombination protein RmuC [Gordonia sp. NPDC003422]